MTFAGELNFIPVLYVIDPPGFFNTPSPSTAGLPVGLTFVSRKSKALSPYRTLR